MHKDVWDDGAPCHTNPAFLQHNETPNWATTPAAIGAMNICNTICAQTGRRTPCAARALTAGTVPGERFTSVADGVIYAGIPCHGDHATLLALHSVAGTTPNNTHCPGCEREFHDETATVVELGQCRRAALGLCSACYKSMKRSGTLPTIREPAPDACRDCHINLVPRGTATVPPGHGVHRGGGRCATCANAYAYQQRKAAA